MDDVAKGGMISNLELLELVFENKVSEADVLVVLKALQDQGDDSLIRWVAILLQRLSALMEVTNRLGDSLSLDALLTRMMEIVCRVLRAERSTLFLIDRGTGELYSRILEGDRVNEIRVPRDKGIAGAVFTTGEGLIINDAYEDPRFNPEVDQRTGLRTSRILCAPLRKKTGEVIGVTQVINKSAGDFHHDDLSMLQALTRQAAAALDNAQLFEQVERARRDEARLLEVTSAISSELQLDTLLQKIVKVTTDFLEADRSTLWLHDEKTDELWSRVAEGADAIRVPCDAGIVGACFISGDTVHIPDAYADSRFNQEVDRKTGYRTRNILCMPVINKSDQVIGVMQVLNKNTGPFTHHDTRRLRAFSAQAAIALENARMFEETINIKNYNESILKSLTNGVITLDNEMRVIKVNDAALKILHTNEERVLNSPAAALFGRKNMWIIETIEKVTEDREMDQSMDSDIHLPDGEQVSCNVSVIPLVDLNDEVIGMMLVIEDISGEKRVKSTMARFMTKDVAEKLMEGGDMALGGQSQECSVLFTDIRKFTTIAEKLGARDTVLMLNDYFTDMVEVIFDYHGILDKFIGDAIMAIFGAPFSTPLDANNAVNAANQMMLALENLNARFHAQGRQELAIGIGINTGEVIAGNVGSPKRMDYTVIGDPVNLASRLEGANKEYGTHILISEFTKTAITDDHVTRELDLITVKGKTKPVSIYESLNYYSDTAFPNRTEVLELFDEGLHQYRNRNFDFAIKNFDAALKANPSDQPSKLYVDRCRNLMRDPPPADWDGVFRMTRK